MRIGRLCSLGAALALVASGIVGVSVSPAHADESTSVVNDTIETAMEVPQVPFFRLLLTDTATTDAFENSWLPQCGEGTQQISDGVWYHLTAPQTGNLEVDVSQSGFHAAVLVLRGSATSPSFSSCQPLFTTTPVNAGDSLYYLVFGDGQGHQGTRGASVFMLRYVASPPTVSQELLPIGTVARDGSVTVGGTVTCAGGDSISTILGSVEQKRRHRSTVTGNLEAAAGQPCDGKPHFWKTKVTGLDGRRFQPGLVKVTVEVTACGDGGCASSAATRTALVLPEVKWWNPWRGRPV